MANRVVAIDPLAIDLLKAGKIDQAVMIHESRHGHPKDIEPFRRRTCSIDLLISDLLLAGKLETAIEIYERYSENPEYLNSFTRKAFFNRARMKLIPFMLKRSSQIDATIAPTILRNQITLAEMAGSTLQVSEALKKFDDSLNESTVNTDNTLSDAQLSSAANACLGIFNIALAIKLTHQIQDVETRAKLEKTIDNYFNVCRASDVDPKELSDSATQIKIGARKKIEKATVVVRISPNIWGALSKMTDINPQSLPDGFIFAKRLKDKGYYVELAPQLSLPGPSLYAPYSQEQKHPLAFVDCHKYSKIGKFIHYKSISNGCLQIERGGYSGWSEITAYPHLHDFKAMNVEEAEIFCEKERTRVFGSAPIRPAEFQDFGDYAVIPLQIPGDSVQRLSKFTFSEMIDASIRFFESRGLNIVLRRHPQCQDREITDYLKQVATHKKVFISELSTRELILHAEAVALCNSSVGWDAILAHKPLFCFGFSEYSRVARQVEEISDLEETESLSGMVKKLDNDLLYYYFWSTQITRGLDAACIKISTLVDKVFSEHRKN